MLLLLRRRWSAKQACPVIQFLSGGQHCCDPSLGLIDTNSVLGASNAAPSTLLPNFNKFKATLITPKERTLNAGLSMWSSIKQAVTCKLVCGSFTARSQEFLCGATMAMLSQSRVTICTGIEEDKTSEGKSCKPNIQKEDRNSSSGSSQGIGHKAPNAGLDGGAKYSVIRINSTGKWEPLVLSISELGVHPRDMDILASNSFIPHRSTITLRSGKVLIRMENVRAIIYKDHCILFDAHHPRKVVLKATSTASTIFKSLCFDAVALQKAREAFANTMAEYVQGLPHSHLSQMPFHLRMLECLLEETCGFFRQKVERLKVVGDKMLEELTTDVNMGGLQRLLPLKRVLTEVEHDIRDTHEAMEQVLNSDDMLQALCLERPTKSHRMEMNSSNENSNCQQNTLRQAAADMLFTYLREVDDAGGVLEEMRKNMDAAQEVWELGLDTTRNRIIRSNLYISIATLSLSVATVPASFLGMNLINGLENHQQIFYYVVGATSTSALVLGAGLFLILRVWPSVVDKRRAEDLAALRDLLGHIDVVDEIFQNISQQGSSMSQGEFRKILKSHSFAHSMREKEIELMFRMFDANRNGLLEAEEWNPAMQQRAKDNSKAE